MDAIVTVFGNIEIRIRFYIQPAERDVGIMSEYVEEWEVTHISGVEISNVAVRTEFSEKVLADADSLAAVNKVIEECCENAG